MRVAFLILAHQEPAHFARLVRALDAEWARFFVHIDRKADARGFLARAPRAARSSFLDGARRVRVSWGGFSQVRATLNLLRAARESHPTPDRFCLLSGADFPARSRSEIRDRFATDTEFLRVDRRLDPAAPNEHTWHVDRFHAMDVPLLNPAASRDPRVPRLARTVFDRVPRRPYRAIPLYQGSQWWALTREAVDYVVAFLERRPDYARFLRFTWAPDEIFFHSILKSSPFAARLSQDVERALSPEDHFASNLHGCHYVDWNVTGESAPKVLDLSDLEAVRASGALFARKFVGARSAELTDHLESLCREPG